MNTHNKLDSESVYTPILNWLTLLGFKIENGASNSYFKLFRENKVLVDFEHNKIKYPDIMQDKIGRQNVTCLLNKEKAPQEENLVVLECICRLLDKGYDPEDIELEKKWNLGHKGKGFLDILIKDKKGNSLFMIECKTWGRKFNQEKLNTFKNGGQLFSYFRQDKKARALCLYSSTIKKDKIDYTNEIIDAATLKGENETEIFDSWNKSFLPNGIFESHVLRYDFKATGLIYENLKDIETSDDGNTIFNQFDEILRRHVVSDKTNAFNKIFNLFICKIRDEDLKKNTKEELNFQYKQGETEEQLIDKLKELYKDGLKHYIKIIIPYITKEELKTTLPDEKINEILYYRESQEFSFKDVYNKETFKDNTEIVKEVVELLQKYKIKYSGKHQYLGDFFERLLNTGIKQESGQFFTPIPLARFICKSLPIEGIITKKNHNKEINFLPYVIDYASGSGHFITEMMDEIDYYVKQFDENEIKGGQEALKKFKSNKDYIAWAKEYVYAIEKDYRLVKISKIASFLNGDGDANVISADGLASFNNEKYEGILCKKGSGKENNVFDIVVANPPYSVSGFLNTLKNGKECFDLFEFLTDKSSEIECLFIERTKQLLKEDGVAGIILPISILTNSGIYERTREILFKNFIFKAIVSLGSNAFMATGTRTIIVFIQKRSISDFKDIIEQVDKFFASGFVDVAVGGIKDAFSTYVKNIYKDLSFDQYCKALKGDKIKHEIVKEYQNLNLEQIKELEKQKLIYFMLTYPQKIILAESGEKDTEKMFYGFEFSNRRGREGIHLHTDEEYHLKSKLYSETNLTDKEKLNTYILKAFEEDENLKSEIDIIQASENHPLKDHIHYLRLFNLMTFDLNRFDKSINLNKKNNLKIENKGELVKLGEVCQIINGITYDKKQDISIAETNYKILTADNISVDNRLILDIKKAIYLNKELKKKDHVKLIKNDILVCTSSGSKHHIGKACYIDHDLSYFAGGFMSIIRNNNKNVEPKYLLQILNYARNNNIFAGLAIGNNINNLGSKLKDLKIPLPSLEIQRKIVSEIAEIEKQENNLREKIQVLEIKIRSLSNINYNKNKLANIAAMIKRGKSPQYGASDIQIIKSGQIRGLYNFDFSKKHYTSQKFILDERKLEKGDILINSTGVGTAGRVNLFNLDGNFVVDTHVTIVRLDKNIVLPKFVLYQLWSLGFHNIEKMANGQSGQVELSKEAIENISIPLPPLSEQRKILSQIEPFEKEIEEAKQFLTNSIELKQELLAKYLERRFV